MTKKQKKEKTLSYIILFVYQFVGVGNCFNWKDSGKFSLALGIFVYYKKCNFLYCINATLLQYNLIPERIITFEKRLARKYLVVILLL